MKNYLVLLLLVFLYSCRSKEQTETTILEDIQLVEDSLREMSSGETIDAKIYKASQERYIGHLVSLYEKFPKSEKAAICLDKVHMVYSGIGDYISASNWADTLLDNYPKYVNRAIVLESQANAYDASIVPRDSAKVRKYYSLLLKEFPNLEKEKRDGILQRLAYNNLNFDQYIEMQMLAPEVIE